MANEETMQRKELLCKLYELEIGPILIESWVEVQKQEGGTLTHTSSKKELKELLASAASEEELSDSDQM